MGALGSSRRGIVQPRGVVTRARMHDFMLRYQDKNGYAPTISEISEAVGVDRSYVAQHLVTMFHANVVKYDDDKTLRKWRAVRGRV